MCLTVNDDDDNKIRERNASSVLGAKDTERDKRTPGVHVGFCTGSSRVSGRSIYAARPLHRGYQCHFVSNRFLDTAGKRVRRIETRNLNAPHGDGSARLKSQLST